MATVGREIIEDAEGVSNEEGENLFEMNELNGWNIISEHYYATSMDGGQFTRVINVHDM